jgi:hypothetical protein
MMMINLAVWSKQVYNDEDNDDDDNDDDDD